MDEAVLSYKLVPSCVLLIQTGVEKSGDIDENSSGHFDFQWDFWYDQRFALTPLSEMIKNYSPVAGLELGLRPDDNNTYESLFFRLRLYASFPF